MYTFELDLLASETPDEYIKRMNIAAMYYMRISFPKIQRHVLTFKSKMNDKHATT